MAETWGTVQVATSMNWQPMWRVISPTLAVLLGYWCVAGVPDQAWAPITVGALQRSQLLFSSSFGVPEPGHIFGRSALLFMYVCYAGWITRSLFWPQLPSMTDYFLKPMRHPYVYTTWFTADRLMLRRVVPDWLLTLAHALAAISVALSAQREGCNFWPYSPSSNDAQPCALFSRSHGRTVVEWGLWPFHDPFNYLLICLQWWVTLLPWILTEVCFSHFESRALQLAASAPAQIVQPLNAAPAAAAHEGSPSSFNMVSSVTAPVETAPVKQGTGILVYYPEQPLEGQASPSPLQRSRLRSPSEAHIRIKHKKYTGLFSLSIGCRVIKMHIKVHTKQGHVSTHLRQELMRAVARTGCIPIGIAMRPGCVTIRLDMHSTATGQEAADESLVRIANAVLPLLHSMFDELQDGRDSNQVDITVKEQHVSAVWDDGGLAWQLQLGPPAAPSIQLGSIVQLASRNTRMGRTSDHMAALEGVDHGGVLSTSNLGGSSSTASSAVHVVSVEVQLLPAAGAKQLTSEQVAAVSGWVRPQPGQHSTVGETARLCVLASVGTEFVQTQVLEASTPTATGAFVKLELVIPDFLLPRHHKGGPPVGVIPSVIELVQGDVTWSSTAVVLQAPWLCTMSQRTAPTAWWWGTTGRVVGRAMQELRRNGAVQLALAAHDSQWQQVQEQLYIWLVSIRAAAIQGGFCTAAPPGLVGDETPTDFYLLKHNGRGLLQALSQLGLSAAADVVHEQLKALSSWQPKQPARRVPPILTTLYVAASSVASEVGVGACWQCQIQAQEKARRWWTSHLQGRFVAPGMYRSVSMFTVQDRKTHALIRTIKQVYFSLAYIAMGVVMVLSGYRFTHPTPSLLLAATWGEHAVVCVCWLLTKLKSRRTTATTGSIWTNTLCEASYTARMAAFGCAVWSAFWSGQQPVTGPAGSAAIQWLALVSMALADRVNLQLNLPPQWGRWLSAIEGVLLLFLSTFWADEQLFSTAAMLSLSAALLPWTAAHICLRWHHKHTPTPSATSSEDSVAAGKCGTRAGVSNCSQQQGMHGDSCHSTTQGLWSYTWRLLTPAFATTTILLCTTGIPFSCAPPVYSNTQ